MADGLGEIVPGFIVDWEAIGDSKISWLGEFRNRLDESGIASVCSGMHDVLVEDVSEFHETLAISGDDLVGTVQGVEIRISAETLRDALPLPKGNLQPLPNLSREECKAFLGYSDPGKKGRGALKIGFSGQALAAVILTGQCLMCKKTAHDSASHEQMKMMCSVLQRRRIDWGTLIHSMIKSRKNHFGLVLTKVLRFLRPDIFHTRPAVKLSAKFIFKSIYEDGRLELKPMKRPGSSLRSHAEDTASSIRAPVRRPRPPAPVPQTFRISSDSAAASAFVAEVVENIARTHLPADPTPEEAQPVDVPSDTAEVREPAAGGQTPVQETPEVRGTSPVLLSSLGESELEDFYVEYAKAHMTPEDLKKAWIAFGKQMVDRDHLIGWLVEQGLVRKDPVEAVSAVAPSAAEEEEALAAEAGDSDAEEAPQVPEPVDVLEMATPPAPQTHQVATQVSEDSAAHIPMAIPLTAASHSRSLTTEEVDLLANKVIEKLIASGVLNVTSVSQAFEERLAAVETGMEGVRNQVELSDCTLDKVQNEMASLTHVNSTGFRHLEEHCEDLKGAYKRQYEGLSMTLGAILSECHRLSSGEIALTVKDPNKLTEDRPAPEPVEDPTPAEPEPVEDPTPAEPAPRHPSPGAPHSPPAATYARGKKRAYKAPIPSESDNDDVPIGMCMKKRPTAPPTSGPSTQPGSSSQPPPTDTTMPPSPTKPSPAPTAPPPPKVTIGANPAILKAFNEYVAGNCTERTCGYEVPFTGPDLGELLMDAREMDYVEMYQFIFAQKSYLAKLPSNVRYNTRMEICVPVVEAQLYDDATLVEFIDGCRSGRSFRAWNEVDLVLIPFLTKSPHWFLLQIDLVNQQILIFDSLPSTPIKHRREQLSKFNLALTRIMQSGRGCRGMPLPKPMTITRVTKGVPAQADPHSCGFFVCFYLRILTTTGLPALVTVFQHLCDRATSANLTPAQLLRQQTALFMYTQSVSYAEYTL